MPLFEISGEKLNRAELQNFGKEKDLQKLMEDNLETVFNCRFVRTEFPTGSKHAGRIDSLALSEDDNPVIIEYKKVASVNLITQSLYYLNWINDHKGDFEIAVQKKLGGDANVDWSDIRVICIAPNYTKYDLHAVEVMGTNIELWKYKRFRNDSLYLEEVFQNSKISTESIVSTTETKTGTVTKNPIMVEAGRKAAITRMTATYTFDEHLKNKPENIKEMVFSIREFILGLDSSIEEVPRKYYVGYKTSQNIACVEVYKQRIKLFLKLESSEITTTDKYKESYYRDVSKIGHAGTGDAEFKITSQEDFENTKKYIELAYNKIGG